MLTKVKSPTTATQQDRGYMTSTPSVDAFLSRASKPETVCYCRVSSAKQRGDWQRQCAQMRSLYPNAEIIRDIGGGLNWKRQGLLSILERIHRGDKLPLVVAHRDRLARFGFELIEGLAGPAKRRAGPGSPPAGCQPPIRAYRRSTRRPPYVQLPDARTPPLPDRNRGGFRSIPTRSRRGR